ncbi:MAG: glycosyltransferase [Gemmatimonadales bacterium]
MSIRHGRANVVYVLPDKLGGVFNFTANLLSERTDDFDYTAILTANSVERDVRAVEILPADRQLRFAYSSPPENLYSYLRRLRRAIPPGEGVLVCNDWVELAMVSAYRVPYTVVNITHADAEYYYRLAEIHEPYIDCFVALTKQIHERLLDRFPTRHASIVRLPGGVTIPLLTRQSVEGRLRVLYVGRVDREKGVFDLPIIDRMLIESGHHVEWTVQGSGPDEEALRAVWQTTSPIAWGGARPLAEVLPLYQKNDVLVLSSKSEGLPVTLLEAGAAGMVPVISDLASGIPEVVDHGTSGFRVSVGDIRGFVDAIARLDSDRGLLDLMSRRVRERVSRDFDARVRSRDYQALYARFRELKRVPVARPRVHYGSRLDKRWLPNALVKALRSRSAAKRDAH